jgi:hypothetical protein
MTDVKESGEIRNHRLVIFHFIWSQKQLVLKTQFLQKLLVLKMTN